MACPTPGAPPTGFPIRGSRRTRQARTTPRARTARRAGTPWARMCGTTGCGPARCGTRRCGTQDEGGGSGEVRAGDVRDGEALDGDAPAGEVHDGDAPAGEAREGEEPALPGKHQVAGDEIPGEDIGDAQRPAAAGRGDGPVPGPRHGSGPAGPDWPAPAPGDSPSALGDSPSALGDSPSAPEGSPATAPGDSPASASGDSPPSGPGQEPPAATHSADQLPGGLAGASDPPADPASRGAITDTMAAELAGWAAGELPGQAAARLASWATAGGAVARSRAAGPSRKRRNRHGTGELAEYPQAEPGRTIPVAWCPASGSSG